ncbi:MAG: hypothetical protein AAF550_01310 [Myxococcota bacterium]
MFQRSRMGMWFSLGLLVCALGCTESTGDSGLIIRLHLPLEPGDSSQLNLSVHDSLERAYQAEQLTGSLVTVQELGSGEDCNLEFGIRVKDPENRLYRRSGDHPGLIVSVGYCEEPTPSGECGEFDGQWIFTFDRPFYPGVVTEYRAGDSSLCLSSRFSSGLSGSPAAENDYWFEGGIPEPRVPREDPDQLYDPLRVYKCAVAGQEGDCGCTTNLIPGLGFCQRDCPSGIPDTTNYPCFQDPLDEDFCVHYCE